MNIIVEYFFSKGWFVLPLLILLSTFFLCFIVRRIYKHLAPRLEKTRFSWDAALLHALIRPLYYLLWIMAILFAFEVLAIHFDSKSLMAAFYPIRDLFLTFLLLWFALRFIKNMEIDYVRIRRKEKKPYDRTTIHAVCQISRIAAIFIAALIFLQTLEINVSALLAFGGAGGLVLGFAAKDLLANFFGALMIYLDRPFSVGDWIRSPDKEIEGHVEHIGWRLTKILTFEKRPLYIPNGTFSTISVENPSRMTHRRIKTHVEIRYEDASKMRAIVKAVEEMVRAHPEIDTNLSILVCFDEFASSSLNFLIQCFTKPTDWIPYMRVQEEIFLKTIDIIEKQGAQCAFPTTSLLMPQGLEVKTLSKS
ncbi:MAG: mechanosensitive ion channel family protein [Simkania negevensis]|nr:mechanosensitive ion channel family protein [Simkania negevensis]